MSQQELEQGDQEVMGVVNGHSHPDAAAEAEKIGKRFGAPEEGAGAQCCECGTGCCDLTQEEFEQEYEQWKQMWCKKDRAKVIACVVICAIVAVLLVTAFYLPNLLIWVVNLGVLSCGMVAAVSLDRFFQRRRR